MSAVPPPALQVGVSFIPPFTQRQTTGIAGTSRAPQSRFRAVRFGLAGRQAGGSSTENRTPDAAGDTGQTQEPVAILSVAPASFPVPSLMTWRAVSPR